MGGNLTGKSVWSLLVLNLLTCHWKFVTGEFAGDDIVLEVDRAIGGYVATTAMEKMLEINGMLENIASTCSAKVESEYKLCEACTELSTKTCNPPPNPVKELSVLIFSSYVLTVAATEVIVSKASKALDRFGKDSLKYLETVGKTAEKLGKSILRGGDRLFKSTGKN